MDRETIKDIFGSDMAQRDPRFLEYCVYRNDILKSIESTKEGLVILNAARGSGKSGLFIQLSKLLQKSDNYLVIAKNSGNVEYPSETIQLTECVNFWKNQLLGWVFSEIGKNTKFAFTEAEINAVEFSENEGKKEKNIVAIMLERIKFKGSPIEKTKLDPIVREEEMIRLLSNNKNEYWLLLDELDDNYNNSKRINNIIAGLLIAAQSITESICNIKIRLTIRPHIMKVLETSYDKVPTLRENQITIRWSALELRTILAKRIESYLKRSNQAVEENEDENNIINKYFDNFDLGFRNEGSKEGRWWVYQTLSTLSMYRPRWLIEYCKLCLEEAEQDKVTSNSAKIALFHFGKNRIAFLEAEHRAIFEDVAKIMNQFSFNRKTNLGNTIQFRDFIKDQIIHTGIVPCDDQGIDIKALEIAKFLHMVDFIQPRETLSRKSYKYHYFIDRPQILSGWNASKNLHWIIHPSFANALDLDDNRAYRAGDDIKISKKNNYLKSSNKTKNRRYRKGKC